MRTALFLLLLLAIAAVPGSLVPQRRADPNGVTQYFADNPDLAPVLDKLQAFDVYSSAWFSAIYLLLFVSLIGCVIPRTKHHFQALRAAPPKTPARLRGWPVSPRATRSGRAGGCRQPPSTSARTQLKSAGYRVARYDGRRRQAQSRSRPSAATCARPATWSSTRPSSACSSPSASAAASASPGQRVLVEGQTFVNTAARLRLVQPRPLLRRRTPSTRTS